MRFAWVIGHRQGSQGAYGNMGISEYIFYNEFIKELMSRLDTKDHRVFERANGLHGYTERMVDLHKRIDEWGADISISLHFNAAGDNTVNGHEILYCSKKGKAIANHLDALFDIYLNNRDRNTKKVTKLNRGGGFVCRGKSVCVLIEPFFGAHQDKFMPGEPQREALISSLIEFTEEVVL